ncbi:ribbon-helix-helix domain-containing protein, partial [Kineococcus sp. G2]|uniref:ribbon-helix-helix domain-containing protein n=1 Tax=Kineococcus sp. G2 TaxID=3127484 RepID=UPI00301D94AB
TAPFWRHWLRSAITRPSADPGGRRHARQQRVLAVAKGVLPERHRLVKLSISLSDADVAALDEHVRQAGLPSRSAAVQQAVRALTHQHPPRRLRPGAGQRGVQAPTCGRRQRRPAVSVDRLGPALGRLPSEALDALDDALRLHLALRGHR